MYWIDDTQSYVGSSRQITFKADTEADIANLPGHLHEGVQQGDDTVSCKKVGYGSFCFVLGTGDVYALNSNDEWEAI